MSSDVNGNAVDLDQDGLIDVIFTSNDSIYKASWDGNGWNVSPIGCAGDGAFRSQIYPADIDLDGDWDIVQITQKDDNSGGVYVWENSSAGWVLHFVSSLERSHYRGLNVADFDLDGQMDILSTSIDYLIMRWGNGGFSYTEDTIARDGGYDRVRFGDFNGDGFLDIFHGNGHYGTIHVYLNNGDRTFFTAYSAQIGVDGIWAADVDADGDEDIIMGNSYSGYDGFYFLENDGSANFTAHQVMQGQGYNYGDGSVAADLNLDGLADVVGTWRKVGWLENISGDFSNYQEHMIENINSSSFYSDFVWLSPLNVEGCLGRVRPWVFIISSKDYSNYNYLISSVLDLYNGSEYGHPAEFYYKACVPNDSALSFFFRGGATLEACTSAQWIGPFKAEAGVDSASFDIYNNFGCIRYLQYKVVFKGDTSEDKDIAVLHEVGLGYQSCPYGVDEDKEAPRKLTAYITGPSTLKLELPYSSKVRVEVYEPTGRLLARIEKALQAGVHELSIPGKGLRLVRAKVGEKTLGLRVF